MDNMKRSACDNCQHGLGKAFAWVWQKGFTTGSVTDVELNAWHGMMEQKG
jgi:hypothetical protein